MNCPKCGNPNPEGASACSACGAPLPAYSAAGGAAPINNYLIPAIFATACCCLPFGIVSIVYAAQVNGKLAAGDVAGAMQSANNAKMWFWISFGLGLAVIAVYFVFGVLGALMGIQQQQGQFGP